MHVPIYPVVGQFGVPAGELYASHYAALHSSCANDLHIMYVITSNLTSNGKNTMMTSAPVEILYARTVPENVSPPSVKCYKFYTFPGNPLIIPRVLSFTRVRGFDVIIVLRASTCGYIIIIVQRLPARYGSDIYLMEHISKEEKYLCCWGEKKTHG